LEVERVAGSSGVSARATLTWSPPEADNGAQITSYTTCCASIGVPQCVQQPADQFDYVVVGAEMGQNVTCSVVATNVMGDSVAVADTAMIAVAPGKPTGVVADSPAPMRVNLTWTPPRDEGGLPVSSYVIYYSEDSTFSDDAIVHKAVSVPPRAFLELFPGKRFYFRIAAVSEAGEGDPSLASSSVTVAAADPTVVVEYTTDLVGIINVKFLVPGDYTPLAGDKLFDYRNELMRQLALIGGIAPERIVLSNWGVTSQSSNRLMGKLRRELLADATIVTTDIYVMEDTDPDSVRSRVALERIIQELNNPKGSSVLVFNVIQSTNGFGTPQAIVSLVVQCVDGTFVRSDERDSCPDVSSDNDQIGGGTNTTVVRGVTAGVIWLIILLILLLIIATAIAFYYGVHARKDLRDARANNGQDEVELPELRDTGPTSPSSTGHDMDEVDDIGVELEVEEY